MRTLHILLGTGFRLAMSLALLGSALPATAPRLEQDPAPEVRAGAPLAVEIQPADPPLDGHGPSRAARYVAHVVGRAYIYAICDDFEAWLRVEKRDGTLLAEDGASGGKGTPFVELDVEPDEELRLVVASALPERGGHAIVVVSEAPETGDSLDAAAWLLAQVEEARKVAKAEGPDATRPILREVSKKLADLPGATTSAQVSSALTELAHAAREFGDTATAFAAWEAALVHEDRCLPPDHPRRIASHAAFGAYLDERGELKRARAELELVEAARERTLPPGHEDLLLVRESLAKILRALADYAAAREVQVRLVDSEMRTRPADDVRLQFARAQLADTLAKLGDPAGARALFEQAVEILAARLATDDPRLAAVRPVYAGVLEALGDFAGAAQQLEGVLDVQERVLADDNALLQRTRYDLARNLRSSGNLERARTLLERVIASRSRADVVNEPQILEAKTHLGLVLRDQGDLAAARKMQEETLAGFALALPEANPTVIAARADLATTLAMQGELAGARVQLEKALAELSAKLPPEHPDLARVKLDLLWTLAGLKDSGDARKLARELASQIGRRLRAASDAGSPRDAERVAAEAAPVISAALSIGSGAGVLSPSSDVDRDALIAIECARAIAGSAWASARAPKPPAVPAPKPRKSGGKSSEPELVDLRKIAAALAPEEAAVAFWTYASSEIQRGHPGIRESSEHMLAFVLRSTGAPVRVELGPTATIESAVDAWRAALGDEQRFHDEGAKLRALAFEPLSSALGDAHRVAIVPAGALALVPFDALPGDTELGTFLGDKIEFSNPTHLDDLRRREPPTRDGGLVLIGACDYDHEPGPGAPTSTERTAACALRFGDRPVHFDALAGAEDELAHVAGLYDASLGVDAHAVSIEGLSATKAAFIARARGARFLHIATRVWSAPETMRGAPPLSTCGLALAGANRPPDALARLAGVISADEIASLDLSSCELAVLSSVEPANGARRAARDLAALQLAFHSAGASSVLASAWPVPDAAKRELLLDLYHRLWVEKQPKAHALWEAKKRLREKKDESGALSYSTRDWAAWVLTGDPR